LQTIKHESKQTTVVKRERTLSSGTGIARPSKVRRETDERIVYLLSSDDEAEPSGASASRTASQKVVKVDAIDLLD
jgi:hypothetical protein